MAFNLFRNTQNDKSLIKRYAEEQIDIAGTEIKYYPVDLTQWKGALDAPFQGEFQKITFLDPVTVKGILLQPPEAAKVWASLGLFTTDSANVVFLKDKLLGELGRRPMPRDRIFFVYNNTAFEIQDVLEDPPRMLFEIFYLNVRVKKLIESFENIETFGTELTTTSAGLSGYTISRENQITSGMIESAMSGTGWKQSEDDIFRDY